MALDPELVGMGPILLVDDDESCLEAMAFLLEEEDCEVVRAHSGPEALTRLASGRFVVMVTDLKMPGFDGLILLERALHLDSNLVVVVTSAFDDPATVGAAMDAGAFDFLPKPCDRSRFKQIVRQAFEHAHSLENPGGRLDGPSG
jgi:DNA-binding NtrC family response regulator